MKVSYFSACQKVYYLQRNLQENVKKSGSVVDDYFDNGLVAEMSLGPDINGEINVSLAKSPVELSHVLLEPMYVQNDVRVEVHIEISETSSLLVETVVSCYYFI